MALDPIATGQIRIDVNDAEAIAALRKIDSEFDKAMREIDRKKAEYTIDADISGLEDAVKNAKRQVRELEGKKASLALTADSTELDEEIAAARKKVKRLDGQKATFELEFKSDEAGRKAALANIRAVEAAQEAADKASARLAKKEADRQKALAKTRTALAKQRVDEEEAAATAEKKAQEQLAKTRTALNKQRVEEEEASAKAILEFRTRMNAQRIAEERAAEKEAHAMHERMAKSEQEALSRVARTREAMWKQRDREMTQAEREAWQLEQMRQREIDAIPRLRSEYAKLAVSIEKMHAARRAARRDPLKAEAINLDIGRAEQDMRLIKQRLQDIGENPPVVIELHPGQKFGENIRRSISQGMNDGGVRRAMLNSGHMASMAFADSFNNGLRNRVTPRALTNLVTAPLAALARLGRGLSDVTVRIGPFTATLRQAFVGLSVLAPVILDVVGALGSLISVMGSGLAGAAGVGTAALAGFGLVLSSAGALMKPLMADFKNLGTLEKAWHMQVLKTGAASEKAQKKLKEFKNALGEVGPTALAAFKNVRKLGDEFDELSKRSRPAFFAGLDQFAKTGRYAIRQFGDEATESFTLVSKGFQGMMKGLRSREAREIFQTLFDQSQKAMPAFGRGLGNLAHAFGNFAASFSKMLPALGGGFEKWTQKVEAFTEDAEKMDAFTRKTVESMRSLGRFLKASGQFLTAFFGEGVESGETFLDMMTRTMNEWTRMIRAGETPGIKRFFEEGVRGTRALYHLLKPVVESFVRWAEMLAPFVRDLMEGAGAIGKFVGWLLRIGPLQNTLSAVVTTLGAMWAIGRISKATRAVQEFTKALWGAKTASTALAATAPAAAVGATAAGAAAGAGAAGKRGKGGGVGPDDLVKGVGAGAAGATLGTRLLGGLRGILSKAGPIGIAIGLGDAIIKSIDIVGQRQTVSGKVNALADNIFNTFTFGLTKSAEEKSAAAFDRVRAAIERNADAKIPKNILNDVLTKQQVDLIPTLRGASRAAAEFIRANGLPAFKAKVELGGLPEFKRSLADITATWGLLKNNSFGTLRQIKANSDSNFKAIAATMGTTSDAGRAAVERNFRLTASAITKRIAEGKTSASTGLSAIRQSFVTHSRGSRASAEANFGAARDAIIDAARKGHITTAEKMSAIRKLWIAALKSYGVTAAEAVALATTGDRGDSKPGLKGGTAPRGGAGLPTISGEARGGLHTVGSPGAVGKDTVPAMFNGQPVMVANGENVAVFNRHQRKALDQRLADEGGLQGFFGKNNKPHYMATGGIVELGRQIQSQGYHVSEHPAFGGVAPGAHSPTGWHYKAGALDINADNFPGGEMAALDKLSTWLRSKGWNVLWRVADHFDHLHVDVGKGGTAGGGGMPSGGGGVAIEMPKIKKMMAEQGLGAMTALSQRVLDTARAAAQASIQSVHDSQVAEMGEAVPGSGGAAPPGKVRDWLRAGLELAGVTATAGNINTLYGRVMQESGGNPNAVNNWDSNAAAGTPSKGLLQTIEPTFRAHMVKGHGNIFNPVHNVAAAVRYMLSRYGRLVGRGSGGYAIGGLIEAAKGALIGEGAAPEWRVDTATGKGYKTNGPELTSLKPTEAIIPTEKRMRGRAIDIMKNIAGDLGFDRFRGGTGPQNTLGTNRPASRPGAGGAKVQPNYRGLPYSGGDGQASSNLGRRPQRAPAKSVKNVRRGSSSFRKRRSAAYQSGRGYVRYIDGLKVAQGDWERELNFREGHVNEPEDLLVEQGRITVYNPETKKQEDVGPRMVPNVAGIEEYKKGLQWVGEAFTNLIAVIQEIIAAIPLALSAINTEEVYRNANISNLKKDIGLHERVIEARGRGKVDKKDREIIKRHTQKKEQAEADLQHEEGVLSTLKEDRRTLKDDHKEAFWDLREIHPQQEKNTQESASLNDRANAMAVAANAETTQQGVESMPKPDTDDTKGGSGTGGSDKPLTLGQQEGLLSNARIDIAKQFGGNSYATPSNRTAMAQAMNSSSYGGGASSVLAGGSSAASSSSAAGAVNQQHASARSAQPVVGGAGATAPGGGDVVINQTFHQMPDPHTWSEGVKYEMQATY